MTTPKVTTVYVSGERFYVDVDGKRAPGVSGILGMQPKPALVRWAAKEAAAFAVANLEAITALAKTDQGAAIDLIKGAPWRKSGKAANSGTEVHGLTEHLMFDRIEGRRSEFRIPPGAMAFLRNFARFVEEFQVTPVMVETTVWDDDVDYAGTFDGIYDITVNGHRHRSMIDTKTGASGVWPEAALQQTAYVNAGNYIDGSTGEKHPMIGVDNAYGLWLRPDGWALIPLNIDNANWDQFRRLRDSFEWKRTREKHAVGKAVNVNPLTKKWSGNR